MILIIWVLIATVSVIIAYIFHGIYIKSFEFKGSIKGFELKFETKEKSAPSDKD